MLAIYKDMLLALTMVCKDLDSRLSTHAKENIEVKRKVKDQLSNIKGPCLTNQGMVQYNLIQKEQNPPKEFSWMADKKLRDTPLSEMFAFDDSGIAEAYISASSSQAGSQQ